ncbi:ParB/RepB/Spo0J family partition protein [Roseospira marina]|uniref:ParB/RepB/Spo0J family partition protein n=1 Tax=Roseospira marina TaxID=140057 RepID=A0A5M6ID98_9PROT|nr:ParB/RepB/Spo0J family partition protein [Roseospira marina]KAA5606250.1 ParB/RepB/Spo0J family partition protein [Roseospira marina]MBB4314405.1 ParB family chromosome partitioning protein [Roseospira marina]MBB5087565.1 ParB family chromosome partitioning protein [Roseospira marina]
MAKRQTLGRGLSALFGEDDGPGVAHDVPATPSAGPHSSGPHSSDPRSSDDGPDAGALADGETGAAGAPAGRGVRLIAVDRLAPSPYQPRRTFDEAGLEELAESVRARGVLQPLLARPSASHPGHFEIVAGERRWRAAQRAGLHEVPVLTRDLTDRETLEVALVENLQRQDLNPIEEADGYRRLIEEFEHSQEILAEVVGKSRSHVANTLRLLQLPSGVRDMVSEGALSAGHARALLTLDNPTVFAEEVVRKGLSVRQTEALARQAASRPAQTRPRKARGSGADAADKDADTLALERDLGAQLGMAVSIDPKPNGGGAVTIAWQSLAQLDEILARLSAGPSAAD